MQREARVDNLQRRDKRRHRRAPVRGQALNRLPDGSVTPAEFLNISEGGVLLMLPVDVKRGDILELELRLSLSAPVRTRGRVVHVRRLENSTLAGVAFLDINERDRRAIGKTIWNALLENSTRFREESSDLPGCS